MAKLPVSIPKPKIQDTVVDENLIEVFNESDNAFNPLRIEDYKEAFVREKNVMIQDAILKGDAILHSCARWSTDVP